MNIDEFINTRLAEVQKPSWYVGGEYGSVVKNKETVNIRFAFCFPDMYDVGMSHLGMKIMTPCPTYGANVCLCRTPICSN